MGRRQDTVAAYHLERGSGDEAVDRCALPACVDGASSGPASVRLDETEKALCESIDALLARAWREELRALYEAAELLHTHKRIAGDDLRASLLRCGRRLEKNRTTLLRYAFVSQRIKRDEFHEYLALSDARGYPVRFWDLIDVAELSRPQRRAELERRVRQRKANGRGGPELSPARIGRENGTPLAQRLRSTADGRDSESVNQPDADSDSATPRALPR
jgi:hypothetical protein